VGGVRVYVQVELTRDWREKSSRQPKENSFHQQLGLKFNEDTTEVLHFEHGFVWC
jgi:hypothetical protein